MAGGALQDLVAHAGVRPGVSDDAGAHGREPAILVASHGVFKCHRVALRVEPDALPAGQRDQHGAIGLERQERCVALDVEVFLRAERAAVRYLRHANLVLGQAEEGSDLPSVLPYSLAL